MSDMFETSVRLDGVPDLDRFFPNCALGLAELVARYKYGFADLKKAWFASTVLYRPRTGAGWLKPNGVDLDVMASIAPGVGERVNRRLRRYYGIEILEPVAPSIDSARQAIVDRLRSGEPVISCFDMAFLQPPQRSRGIFRPHMVGVIGVNAETSSLVIVDQVKGTLEVTWDDYVTSFERFAASDCAFVMPKPMCRRPRVAVPLEAELVLSDLRESCANLFSPEPYVGLNAVRALGRDVEQALEEIGCPFSIPGVWIFSHDRNCLRSALPYWREAGVIDTDLQERLEEALTEAFDLWFQVDMSTELAFAEEEAAHMRAAVDALHSLSSAEERIGELFGEAVARNDGGLRASVGW